MRIVIAGGTGLLGRALTTRLTSEGHEVIVLTRHANSDVGARVRAVAWMPDGSAGPWAREIDGADGVINLAGAGIAEGRWTPSRKTRLRSSRIDSTRSLVTAVAQASTPPPVFVQGSAVGYYGSTLDAGAIDESSPAGSDFLARLAVEWESAANAVAAARPCRLVIVRTGVALSREGGALPRLAQPFRFFVGGPIGTGRQFVPWITIGDWVAMVVWAIQTPAISGPINATAPEPVTNAQFASALARVLRRPNLFPVPSFVLRILLGEMADAIVLGGQRVVPALAQAHGFAFAQADLERALAAILRP